MKQINQELDEARKKAKKEIEKIKNKKEKAKKLEVIKNSKYILLKNYKELNGDEKNKLKEVQDCFPKLKQIYAYKEKFRLIYETSNNWQEGLLKIASWLRRNQGKMKMGGGSYSGDNYSLSRNDRPPFSFSLVPSLDK